VNNEGVEKYLIPRDLFEHEFYTFSMEFFGGLIMAFVNFCENILSAENISKGKFQV
jgi:hypothetical protein